MDPADYGSAQEEKNRQWAIEDALRRPSEDPLLDEENRRICRECEELIPLERLIARPDAVRCVSCQAEPEG